MATVTYIKERTQTVSAMRAVMRYCMKPEKIWDEQSQRHLISGVNCDGGNTITEFLATKTAHGKLDGINFYQYVSVLLSAGKADTNAGSRNCNGVCREGLARS